MIKKSDAQQEAVWSLMAKKLSHELTPEEDSKLAQELELDPSLAKMEETISRINLPHSSQTDEAMQERILLKTYRKIFDVKPRHRVWRIVSSAAAIAALLIGVGFWGYTYLNKPNFNVLTAHCPKGVYTSMLLPDSSVVYLNGGSSLTYPIAFDHTQRSVELEGEGYFEVRPDADRPFTVNTADIAVKVLGTSFNVKSYLEDSYTIVTLAEGSVAIDFKDTAESLTLKPDDQVVIERGSNHYTLSNKVDTELYTVWREGKFAFKRTSFGDLCKSLERRYDCKIILNSNKHNSSTFTGKFNRGETLEQVLSILKLNTDISYNIDGDTVYIY